jgi:hypothetical protein
MPSGRKKVFLTKLTDVLSSDVEGIGTHRREGEDEYLFLKGVSGTILGSVVIINSAGLYTTALLTRALGAATCRLAVAMAVIGASKWGWYQIAGYSGAILAGADCVHEDQLYTDTGQDATGGIDDDGSSEHAIHGMTIGATVPATSPATAVGMLSHPWAAPVFD